MILYSTYSNQFALHIVYYSPYISVQILKILIRKSHLSTFGAENNVI